MSSAELAHLFPSATHPALPIAASILSTLRALTAPGKGNDLRAEERAALAGVAALLACERIQSHDLAPSAVQRASSVSPTHFKSALATARRLLASSAASLSSPSSRSSHSSHSIHSSPSSRSAHSAHSAPSTPSANRISTMPPPTPPTHDPLSPFMTPRKKYRAPTTRDLSALLTPQKHAHTPVASSPLRSSTTPKKRGAEDADEEATPKRARLDPIHEGEEAEDRVVGDPQTPSRRSARAAARMKEREGAAAFLALMPGRQPQLVVENVEKEEERAGPALARADLEAEIDGVLGRRRRRPRARRDWTFREEVWAPDGDAAARILAAVVLDGADAADPGPKAKGKGKALDFGAQLAALLQLR